ncbi:MAG TPA: aminotransferase class IV [Gemmataceae bacterium]|jgi:branched-subunit amino acid aminotransferase/4-amino-4-deoxychorismate lyase|nr:aminotransferase class IV [Gemmataceae bacterium]
MPEPLVYLNDRFIPQGRAHLGFNDAGFVFGATATDLCRTFRHQLFRLPEHVGRFRQSCGYARIPQPLSDHELAGLATELAAHNAALLGPEQDLALVLVATPGPIGYYAGQPGGPGDGPATLCLHTFPLPLSRYARLFREGARLIIPATRHVPAASVDPRAKQRSRLHWWLAEQEVHAIDPAASALLLDADGRVTETASANFLLVRDGRVLSPPRRSILGGVSLQVVEELCGALGIPFEERPFVIEDCLAGQEALLTSTPYCVAGVSRINDRAIPWPGPVWRRLLDTWSARVGLDIAGQMEESSPLL